MCKDCDKLPEDVRNLFDRLQKSLQRVIEDLSRNEEGEDKEQALWLSSSALSKINRDFASNFLKELSKGEDETVRINATKMLKNIFDESEGKKEH